jgi:membrane protease YdiL (CAAX protease family)
MPDEARRRDIREVVILYGITLVVTVGLTLLQGSVGWLRGYLLVFVAATFLYLPIEVLQRRGLDPADFGIHRERPGRSLLVAGLVMAVTFPPYLIGFHVWQTHWLGRSWAPATARYDRWPVEVEDEPRLATFREGEVRFYTEGDELVLAWHLPAGQPFEARVDSDADVIASVGRSLTTRHGHALEIAGPSDGRVRFAAPGSDLTLDVEAGGDRLPAGRLRLGTALAAADAVPYRAHRSYRWLLDLILVQFLLVALPEEVFYRGYLQTRLDRLIGRDRRVLGVDVNVASLLLTSALFAVGHIATIPNPQRLAVFFPSLLFGWMRRASRGVTASTVYHASCNILVDLLGRLYG